MKDWLTRTLFFLFSIIGLCGVLCNPARGANCPYSLGPLGLVGQSADGKAYAYAFYAVFSETRAVAARIQIADATGAIGTLTVPRYVPRYSGESHKMTFMWSSANVKSLTPIAFKYDQDGDFISCAGSASEISADAPTEFITYGLPAMQYLMMPSIGVAETYQEDGYKDASFRQRVEPDYPRDAKDAGITGRVVVGADVKPDGGVANAWVLSSSQSMILDTAAVSAAGRSTFNAAKRKDLPVKSVVTMEYDFVLPSQPAATPQSACHVFVSNSLLEGRDQLGEAFYEISLFSDTSNIHAVTIDLQKRNKTDSQSFTIPVTDWTPTLVTTQGFGTSVDILDAGNPIASVQIESAQPAGQNTPQACNANPVLVWDLTGGKTVAVDSNQNLAADGVRLVGYATFARKVWPDYPASEAAQQHEGSTILIIQIDKNGTPGLARVLESSGNSALDDAAVHAALASSFKPGQPGLFQAVYQFSLAIPKYQRVIF